MQIVIVVVVVLSVVNLHGCLTVLMDKSSIALIFSLEFSFFPFIFLQTFHIFVFILAFKVGNSPTQESPGYVTVNLPFVPFYSHMGEFSHLSDLSS